MEPPFERAMSGNRMLARKEDTGAVDPENLIPIIEGCGSGSFGADRLPSMPALLTSMCSDPSTAATFAITRCHSASSRHPGQ